jgi:hypothetical protein
MPLKKHEFSTMLEPGKDHGDLAMTMILPKPTVAAVPGGRFAERLRQFRRAADHRRSAGARTGREEDKP